MPVSHHLLGFLFLARLRRLRVVRDEMEESEETSSLVVLALVGVPLEASLEDELCQLPKGRHARVTVHEVEEAVAVLGLVHVAAVQMFRQCLDPRRATMPVDDPVWVVADGAGSKGALPGVPLLGKRQKGQGGPHRRLRSRPRLGLLRLRFRRLLRGRGRGDDGGSPPGSSQCGESVVELPDQA